MGMVITFLSIKIGVDYSSKIYFVQQIIIVSIDNIVFFFFIEGISGLEYLEK